MTATYFPLTWNGLPVAGLATNRPTNASPGHFYISADTGAVEFYDGTAWIRVATITGGLALSEVIKLPFKLPALANGQIVQCEYDNDGTITQMDVRIGNVVGSTVGGATLTPVINGVVPAGASAGGVALTAANSSVAGAKISGSTCPGANITGPTPIGFSVSGVTAFLPNTAPGTYSEGFAELHVTRRL